MDCDVLIVGAGPTGLTLAAELRRRGVDGLLIDALDAPQAWDRATVVHPRSLEIFEALGIVDHFLEAGVPQRGARLHSAAKVLVELDFSLSGAAYPYNIASPRRTPSASSPSTWRRRAARSSARPGSLR